MNRPADLARRARRRVSLHPDEIRTAVIVFIGALAVLVAALVVAL